MHLISIQVGTPTTHEFDRDGQPLRQPWTTAIFKDPVAGPIWAGGLGLSGDRVHDTSCHGGPWRALLMYSQEHYPRWHRDLGRTDLGPGGFGENLTVSGLEEASTCIGDVLAIGEVRLEVTSPRGPCTTLARRLGVPEIIRLVLGNHRSGWYLKVLKEGWLEAGTELTLIHRPHPEWSVVRAADAHVHRRAAPTEARLLAQVPGLMPEWRDKLLEAANAA
jgi:MOSC domain-containing protein YiiM